ncbi:hypothetical protein RB195_009149 [Necator americanus]|uniref:Reverse transcriptase domain-containing protein n=1 Tax=Necator americanus TaxID=51031 RepID=A0ABR1CRY6_NECAM
MRMSAKASSTNEAGTMLKELNETGKRIGLRINRTKIQFMKKSYCEDEGVQLEGSQIVETSSYVYLGRSMNMENDLKKELEQKDDTSVGSISTRIRILHLKSVPPQIRGMMPLKDKVYERVPGLYNDLGGGVGTILAPSYRPRRDERLGEHWGGFEPLIDHVDTAELLTDCTTPAPT